MSNLYKAGYVYYDLAEKFVIDSNDLANEKIEAFHEREVKRQKALMAQAEGFDGEIGDSDFVPGIDMEQISQLTEDQGVIEPFPDPQFDMEAMQAEIDLKLQQAQEQADAIIQNAQEQAQAIMDQAQDDGHRQGYEAGYQEGVAAAESLKQEIENQRADLEAEYQQLVEGIEPEMVDALTSIYEHVLGIELKENKGIILHLLKTTLSRIEPGNDLIVHVSSDDYDDVIEERPMLEACVTSPNTSMEIIEDPLLKENECMIECDSGIFDCSLGVELSEISRKLKLLSYDRPRK
ncbi:FliH/SctL family protein [Butyrivibrio sp. YAB3001]|uniref:FliH/SctL family protein n=1 Tax=Butyrivibrio sp. YAB3001 TaxID=1520812 RepID=UPI0008F65C47|nr:FliH/SctL family protein [Butyrivibrio sp. YAB3001]SFB66707.1 flagellar assembly protein FliH [Butyrivibrio sp. YAB3001]